MDDALDVEADSYGEKSDPDKFLEKRRAEFERDLEADRDNRREAYDDLRFVADPATQWDSRDRQTRESDHRPCPSLNRLVPFLKQVTATIRTNKPEINLKPVETEDRTQAECFEGIINHIERNSNAARQYAAWADDGVSCGVGHLRGSIVESEINPEFLDAELERIEDPLSVIWDSSSVKSNRSDARRCWVIDYMPDEEIEDMYPDAVGEWPDEEESTAWTDWHDSEAEETRVCEYYCIKQETVSRFMDLATGEKITIKGEEPAPEGLIPLSQTTEKVCRVWLLTGGKILEGGVEGQIVPGGRIPIFPYIPNEKRIGRRRVRKGIIRDAKDSVRMINWAMALMIEAMAATPKPKWTGPSKAFEGFEDEWANASLSNKAYLPYNDKAAAPPTYNQPPPFNVGLVNAMQVFDENIKQVTGIYDASLGARSNETSGRAIRAREEQGDMATFDYIDEFNHSLKEVGRWLVRVIPEIYTQERFVRILGKDSQEKVIQINGFDPVKGPINPIERTHFDIAVKVGPGFATQREEAAETMKMAIQSAPQLAPILMDLMISNEDWPGSEKAAKRLAEMLPPNIKAMEKEEAGEPPNPQEQQMQAMQMQMQQRAMNADLQLKEAQAAKAMAEAQKAAQPEVPAQVDNSQAQLRAFEIQEQSQLKREEMAQNHQIEREKMAQDALNQDKQLLADLQKFEMELRAKLAEKAMEPTPELPQEEPQGPDPLQETLATVGTMIATLQASIQQQTAVQAMPKRIVRDEAGNIVGAETVSEV